MPIESPDRRTQYAFPPLPVPPVLAPAKASLPVRILLAHRDRKSHWASFVARRLLSHWRLLYRLSELAPGLTRQDSAIRFTLGRIDRVFTFDARYAVYRPFYLYPVYEPELFLLLQHLARRPPLVVKSGGSSRAVRVGSADPLRPRVGL